MVFSATPLRRYSTSGCQFGIARAKLTARDSSNISVIVGAEAHLARRRGVLLRLRALETRPQGAYETGNLINFDAEPLELVVTDVANIVREVCVRQQLGARRSRDAH